MIDAHLVRESNDRMMGPVEVQVIASLAGVMTDHSDVLVRGRRVAVEYSPTSRGCEVGDARDGASLRSMNR